MMHDTTLSAAIAAAALLLAGLALAAAPAHGAQPGDAGAGPNVATPNPATRADAPGAAATAALGCLIEASAVAEVGSSVIGVIDTVSVERGDVVRKGQVLAQLDAKVERAAVLLAQTKLRSQADIQAARSQKEFLVKKAERTAALTDLKFVSSQARDQADSEASMAEMRLTQAHEQQALVAQELQLSRAQLAQRVILSPLSGVVVDRYVSSGERVENRPILKIAQIDPLKVEVVLPASQFSVVKSGMTARVTPELQGTSARTASVMIVDRVIDAASNTFRARLSLPNSDLALPSGVRCKVEFGS